MQSVNIQGLLDHATQQHFIGNAIIEYICNYMSDSKWPSVESFIQQLEMASCANGSWGEDTIYTHLILDKLSNESWRDAINQALESYLDATDEEYTPETMQLENLVTFAVDWFASELASYIRSHNRVYVVTLRHNEPHMTEYHAFLFENDAEACLDTWMKEHPDYAQDCGSYLITEERV